MRTQTWLASVAVIGVMIWTALLGASPTLDPPIWQVPNQSRQTRDWSTFAPGPIWTGDRADQGDWLHKPLVPYFEMEKDTIEPAVAWSGSFTSIDAKEIVLITSSNDWSSLWKRHKGERLERNSTGSAVVPEINFDHWMVIAIFAGKGASTNGYGFVEARVIERTDIVPYNAPTPAATKRSLRVRVAAKVYQTMEGVESNPSTTAYGIFVLPRSDLPIRLEAAQYHRLDQPPTWKELTQLRPKD